MRHILFSLMLAITTICQASPNTTTYSCNCDLPAPQNLKAVEVGTTYATLRWDAVVGAVGYQVSLMDTLGNLIHTALTTETTIFEEDLESGLAYEYRVAAVCLGGGVSTWFSIVAIKPVVVDLVVSLEKPRSIYQSFCEENINNIAYCQFDIKTDPYVVGKISRKSTGEQLRFEIKYKNTKGGPRFILNMVNEIYETNPFFKPLLVSNNNLIEENNILYAVPLSDKSKICKINISKIGTTLYSVEVSLPYYSDLVFNLYHTSQKNNLTGGDLNSFKQEFGNNSSGQWISYFPNFGDTISIDDINVLNENTVWAAGYRVVVKDESYGFQETDSTYITVTNDGGTNWETHTVPLGKRPIITSISALDGNICYVAGLTEYKKSMVLKTVDRGKSWSTVFSPNFGNGNSVVNYVHFFDQNHGIVQADPKNGEFLIFNTQNGGLNWTLIHPDSIPNPLPGEFGYSADSYGNDIWFNTSLGRIYRSQNKGQSWMVYQTPFAVLYGQSFSDSLNGIGYFGYFVQDLLPTPIIITNDGGMNWKTLDLSIFGEKYAILGYEYIPNSTYIMLNTCIGSITTGNFATWISPDRGETWQQVSSGENIFWPTFISPTIGWGGEGQQFSHKTQMFKYTGSPLVGLFSGKTLTQDWSISPNPCVDHFNLEIKSDKTESYMLLINDVQGKLVYTQSFVQDGTTPVPVNFGKLSAGNYVVTLLSKEGKAAKWIVVGE